MSKNWTKWSVIFRNFKNISTHLVSKIIWRCFISKTIKENFVIIPREIIEMKTLFPMRGSVFVYLAIRRSLDDKAYIMLNDLVTFSGYKSDKNKNGVNQKFITILDTLESLNHFTKEFGDYSGNRVAILKINIDKFDSLRSFAYITFSEIKKMQSFNSKNYSVSFSNLILTLAYIRVNKLRRAGNQQSNPKKKPEFFYRQVKQIAFDIGLSERTVSKCIQVLNDLDIIVSRPMPRYKDKYDNWHTDVTLFVDKFDGWENELNWGEEFLMKNKSLHQESNQHT